MTDGGRQVIVYVLERGFYSDAYTAGVYSTFEQAKQLAPDDVWHEYAPGSWSNYERGSDKENLTVRVFTLDAPVEDQ